MSLLSISDAAARLQGYHPDSATLRTTYLKMSAGERLEFIRLILFEGVPKAFEDQPILYERIRTCAATLLHVDSRSITLIGSARIGYVMSPRERYGRPFDETSDLDLSLVSSAHFSELAKAFRLWQTDYTDGKIQAVTEREAMLWPSLFDELPRTIRRGFLDHYKIPFRYSAPRTMQAFLNKLQNLVRGSTAPRVRRISLRTYNSWSAFERQLLINLDRIHRA